MLDSGLHCSGVQHASPVLVVTVSLQLLDRSSRVLGVRGSARQIAIGAVVAGLDESALLTRSQMLRQRCTQVAATRTFGFRRADSVEQLCTCSLCAWRSVAIMHVRHSGSGGCSVHS